MKRNLYVSNLDSPLSYHIAQFFREDHQEVDPSIRIVGSSSEPIKQPWIHASINFQKHPQLACRAVLDCNVVILDLRQPSHEAETILRFLKQVGSKSDKTIRVIGLSTLLTWEGVRCFRLESDKETMMAKAIDQNQWETQILKDEDYESRISGFFATKCYELQNLLLSLNQNENINASVLGIGVTYGKENEFLQSNILRCLSNEQIDVWGQGGNFIPLVHIQTVLQSLKLLIQRKNCNYTITKDSKSFTQAQIKKFMAKAVGSKSIFETKEPLFVTVQQIYWTFQPNLTCSDIYQQFSQERNFQKYCSDELMTDLCEYTQWSPSQCVLFVEKFDDDLLETIRTELIGKIEMINQDEIQKVNTELMMQCLPDPELDPQKQKLLKRMTKQQLIQQELETQPPRYSQTFETILNPRRFHSFIIICSLKMKEFLEDKYFIKGLTEVVNENQEKEEKVSHKLIKYKSNDWFDLTGIEKMEDVKEDSIQPVKNNTDMKVFNPKELNIKKDDKMVITTQYLLDSVLGAISEAKFNIKTKGKSSIRALIDELKDIYARGNYQPCLMAEQTLSKTATSSKVK